jgi:hypothetical protein
MVLPAPGPETSKMLSKSQSSFAKRALRLCVSVDGIGVETTSDHSGEHKVADETTCICSTERGKVGLSEVQA